MVTSLLWVALAAGMEGAPDSEYVTLTAATVQALQEAPDADPPAPGVAAPEPVKETRSIQYETSPGPTLPLETGRTPTALQ